eukprot:14542905-Alexandrium_andersonii.AAC.1
MIHLPTTPRRRRTARSSKRLRRGSLLRNASVAGESWKAKAVGERSNCERRSSAMGLSSSKAPDCASRSLGRRLRTTSKRGLPSTPSCKPHP